MAGYWLDIALVAFLVLLNALFAGSEMALVSLREGQLRQLERSSGPRARRLVALARDPNRFLATIQIGITLAGFLASATAAVSLAEPLVPYLTALGGAAEVVAVAGVTLVLTFLTLVFGELAPKRLAMQRPLPWALVVARPLDVLSTISRPAVSLLGASTNLVVRLFGGRAEAAAPEMSPDELRDLVLSQEGLDPEHRAIVGGALELRGRTLREVLVPRGAVFSLDATATIDDARAAMAKAGHSRAPVAHRGLDDVVGVVHWAALVDGGSAPVVDTATPALVMPSTVRLVDAVQRFRQTRQQLAIVVDEHGDVDGIVTLEDLFEEIVGEIYDETDPDVADTRPAADGTVVLPGSFPLHDLADVGVEVSLAPQGHYTTVAGLVLAELGRVPQRPGDAVVVQGWRIDVLEVTRRAVTRVRLTRLPTEAETEPGD